MSLFVMVFVTSPSRSRTRPAADGCRRAVRGCTKSSTGSVHRTVRRSRPELVAAHRHRGTGHDDRAAVGRHGEELLVLGARREHRHDELGEARADGQLQPRGRRRGGAGVLDDEPPERPLARDDPRGLEFDADPVVEAPEHERDRDEHRGEQGEAEEGELDPAEHPRDHEGDDGTGQHEPSGGRHHARSRVPRTRRRHDRSRPRARRAIERMPRSTAPRRVPRCGPATASTAGWPTPRLGSCRLMPPGTRAEPPRRARGPRCPRP